MTDAQSASAQTVLPQWFAKYSVRSALRSNAIIDRLTVKAIESERTTRFQLMLANTVVRNWPAQPAEILEMICCSLSPSDQYHVRRALRLTCKAFARKIKPFPGDFLQCDGKTKAVILLRTGMSAKYVCSFRMNIGLSWLSMSVYIVYARRLDLLSTNYYISPETFYAAVVTGQVKVLQWLHQHGYAVPERFTAYDKVNHYYRIHRKLTHVAAQEGQVHCLRYLYSIGIDIDTETVRYAVVHLDCLRFIDELGRPINDITAQKAASAGKLECLQFIYEKIKSLSKHVSVAAAQNGHLACLQFAYEHGAAWSKQVCQSAVRNRHFECLKWAHLHGCPLDKTGRLPIGYYNTCQMAADAGSIECLRYCHENGISLNQFVYESAKRSKNAACIEYVKTHMYYDIMHT